MAKSTTPLGVRIDYSDYWKKRKRESFWVRLKVDYGKMNKLLHAKQFNIDDFCEALFKSEKKSELAKKMIEYIKNAEEGVYFKDMVEELGISRSTGWQVYLSLKRAGIIQRKTKADPITLSTKFSEMIEDLIFWWKSYVKIR